MSECTNVSVTTRLRTDSRVDPDSRRVEVPLRSTVNPKECCTGGSNFPFVGLSLTQSVFDITKTNGSESLVHRSEGDT